ncbi:nucleoside triphosphate pyrophosphohydrolase [Candidatus Termititenax persephonae]|uniref:Nucleoside triphosphate pyrophosphohydrolase n=1 Tax=Candidatus Termititenax persephonae TaxID=2218525 RepID=A0A388TG22_9BACT|nr:nucleoside triphosphate pyrophosphohydrolase [Candidatus Termititenax persephonae]
MEEFNRLHETIRRLRAPDGCPWDRVQTHDTLKPYLLEETYETLDALDKKNPELLKEELGDLLLQIVLHSVIAAESNDFTLGDVARGITEKMIRRHPHVFADTKVSGQSEVWQNWERIKKTESSQREATSILDSVPRQLPALFRAAKIQKKAARAGFDFTETKSVLTKIKEEIVEFEEASLRQAQAEPPAGQEKIIDEFGDILFSLVNLARKLDFDAEDALRLSTKKFETRFRKIENKLRQEQKDFKECSAAELDRLWGEAKLST